MNDYILFNMKYLQTKIMQITVFYYFPYILQQAEDFNTFGESLRNNNIDFALLVSFSTSPVAALRDIKRSGINIIVAFFGPNTARNVLCLVRFCVCVCVCVCVCACVCVCVCVVCVCVHVCVCVCVCV